MSLIEIPDPPGYSVVAYRSPKKGEWFVNVVGLIACADYHFSEYSYPILQPLEVWRDATIDDLRRAPVRARFSDDGVKWCDGDGELRGIKLTKAIPVWIADDDCDYKYCQVLESPHS